MLLSSSHQLGPLIVWKSSVFDGAKIFNNDFALSVEFCSKHDNSNWILTCVYGPCTPEGKGSFLNWFKEIQMPENTDWMVLGDFNLIRKT